MYVIPHSFLTHEGYFPEFELYAKSFFLDFFQEARTQVSVHFDCSAYYQPRELIKFCIRFLSFGSEEITDETILRIHSAASFGPGFRPKPLLSSKCKRQWEAGEW